MRCRRGRDCRDEFCGDSLNPDSCQEPVALKARCKSITHKTFDVPTSKTKPRTRKDVGRHPSNYIISTAYMLRGVLYVISMSAVLC